MIIKVSKNKLVNRSVLINQDGKIKSYYDKIHMYDVILSKKEKYFESKTFTAGKKLNHLIFLGVKLVYLFVMI